MRFALAVCVVAIAVCGVADGGPTTTSAAGAGAGAPSVKIIKAQAMPQSPVAQLSVEISPRNFRVGRDGTLVLTCTCPKQLDTHVFRIEFSDLPLRQKSDHGGGGGGGESSSDNSRVYTVYVPQLEVLAHHIVVAELRGVGSGSVLATETVILSLELDDEGGDELVLVSPPMYPEFFTSHVPDQDYKYHEIFGFRTNGTFVEVGASDGKAYSNTYALADIGWRGLYIDPCPVEVRVCARNHIRHPRVTVHQAAITNYEGTVDVHIAGQMSTIIPEMVDLFRTISWATDMNSKDDYEKTRATTLDTFLEENKVDRHFQLLVIDAEGSEVDIIRGFNIEWWRPEAVLIELMDFHPDFNKSERVRTNCGAVREMMRDAGYGVYWQDVADTLFVADPSIKMQHEDKPIRSVIDGEVVSFV